VRGALDAHRAAPPRKLRELFQARARERAVRRASATLDRLGYEVRPRQDPLTPEELRRARLLRRLDTTVVLDVGASVGMYARGLRRLGFDSRIVSFEPLAEAFAQLEGAAKEDPRWDCRRTALGSSDGTAEINVAGNSTSSSLLEMEERQVQSAPKARYVRTEQVPVARLDSIWPQLVSGGDRVFLKLDVQGFELEVLKGAEACLPSVDCIQAELSFVPLYADAPSFVELIEYLGERGFRLAGLEQGHDDVRTGEMLQADGMFLREDLNRSLLPKLSIITPSLNQGEFIERTIRSVLDQGYENLEYMIVDGGSTDSTVETIRHYEDRIAWWVSEPDEGQTDALNKGLAHATGDVLAYINSDDYYLPGAFETATRMLEHSGASWVAGAARYVDENGTLTEVWRPQQPQTYESTIRGRHWWMLAPWSVPQPSSFWTRELQEEVGTFRRDMHYVFDSEYFLRFVYAGHMPALTDEELSVRVVHPAAKSANPELFREEAKAFVEIFAPSLTPVERVRLRLTQLLLWATPVRLALNKVRALGSLVLGRVRRSLRALRPRAK
jgi:FkbM family methyltransferase